MLGTLSGGDLLYLASFVVVPVVAFLLALRLGGTRGQIILATALAGLLPGLLMPLQVLLAGESWAVTGVMVGWLFPSAIVGAGIGVAGLLLLEFRRWLEERPGSDAV